MNNLLGRFFYTGASFKEVCRYRIPFGVITKLHSSHFLLSFSLSECISTRSSVGARSANALDDKAPASRASFWERGREIFWRRWMDGWMDVVRCRSYGAWIQNNEHKSKCLSMVVIRKSEDPALGVFLFLYLGLV